MWKIPEDKLRVVLPSGFSLIEDGDFVHLFYGEEKIASFYQSIAHPEIIKKVAEAYIRKKMP